MPLGIASGLFLFQIQVTQSILNAACYNVPYLYNVHGSHSQASAVHHATNVTVEGDVVEVVVCRLHLRRVLLRPVTLVKDRFLSEVCVVVETNLGVEAKIYNL